jgi:hypothetical protein
MFIKVDSIGKSLKLSLISFTALTLFSFPSQANNSITDDFFNIADTKTEIVDVSDAEYQNMLNRLMSNMHISCQDSNLGGIFDTGSASPLAPAVEIAKDATEIVEEGNKIIDGLINIGSKIWAIVKAGKPVVNINIGPSANALPQGVKCWDELETWQVPNVMRLKSTATNAFGFSLAEFQFDVIFTYGGSLNGKGKYLTHVQVFPSDVYTFWMQELNASVNVASLVNMGTTDEPIAGMQVDVEWQFKNFLNEVRQSASVFVQGDGQVRQIR